MYYIYKKPIVRSLFFCFVMSEKKNGEMSKVVNTLENNNKRKKKFAAGESSRSVISLAKKSV